MSENWLTEVSGCVHRYRPTGNKIICLWFENDRGKHVATCESSRAYNKINQLRVGVNNVMSFISCCSTTFNIIWKSDGATS